MRLGDKVTKASAVVESISGLESKLSELGERQQQAEADGEAKLAKAAHEAADKARSEAWISARSPARSPARPPRRCATR